MTQSYTVTHHVLQQPGQPTHETGLLYDLWSVDVHCLMTLTLCQGVTFRVVRGEMVIARILHGSSIDRQGMLHTGDIIREVNGQEVGSDPLELQELLRDCNGSITLKVLPSYKDTPAPPQVGSKKVSFLDCLWSFFFLILWVIKNVFNLKVWYKISRFFLNDKFIEFFI